MSGDGYLNMATDEILFQEALKWRIPPTLRFYGWEGDWVSLGFFQKPERGLNLQEAEKLGVKWVRRPTGGKAVVHTQDLTYSLAAGDAPAFGLGSSLQESYRQVARALASGFTRLGLPVDALKKGGDGSFPVAGGRSGSHASGMVPCFAVVSDYEITVGGKKLVGSAQYRKGGGFLQHGSIPLTNYNRELAKQVLNSRRMGSRGDFSLNEELDGRYATLEEAAGKIIPRQKVTEALKEGFAETFGVKLEERPLSVSEKQAAEKLAAEKYASQDWNESRGRGNGGTLASG